MFASLEQYVKDNVTYEVSLGKEDLHPDPEISARFIEAAMSDCEFGCKIYADTFSSVKVLAHSPSYGCNKMPPTTSN